MHQCILSTQGDIALCTARPQYAPMHKGIDYILAKLMARNGDNQVSLSKATGVGQSTISRILKPNGPKGIKSPTDDQVSRLAAHYLVSTDQLRGRASIPGLDGSTGEAEVARPAKSLPAKSSAELVRDMLAKHGKGLSEDARKQIVKAVEVVSAEPDAPSNVISHDFSGLRARPEEILIPQYDVRGAMGHGQVPADYNEAIRNLVIREDVLREKGVTYTSPEALAMITGWGQSMEGTINDKDPVIVDRGVTEFIGEGVYVLTWHGLLYIKRVQQKDADHFWLISDNPNNKDLEARIDDVTIHAKVLLVWNARKV